VRASSLSSACSTAPGSAGLMATHHGPDARRCPAAIRQAGGLEATRRQPLPGRRLVDEPDLALGRAAVEYLGVGDSADYTLTYSGNCTATTKGSFSGSGPRDKLALTPP
jgi:hypothetical protein